MTNFCEITLNSKKIRLQNDAWFSICYRCTCGKCAFIPAFKDKAICKSCGKYVFKDNKTMFKYYLNQAMKKVGNAENEKKF